jgi:hypothetical protein
MKINAVSEIVNKRIEIAKLFYPLEKKLQRRLAKNLVSGFNKTVDYLGLLAKDMDYTLTVIEENFIVWMYNNKSKIECMFNYMEDPKKLDLFLKLLKKIKKYSPTFTYAFVNQKKDGDCVFDIFRFSKFSYLEHCNRVKYS